jgi:hypothetical protein
MSWQKMFSRGAVLWLLGVALALACGCAEEQTRPATPGAPSDVAQADASEETDTDPSALADFREPLAPYGRWVDDPTYGTVWVPNADAVGGDFAPYVSAGHWALTEDDEWLWVSDYEWGWAPFHYGRWVWIDGTGWAWIAGGVYAPAWVVWQTGYYDDAYIGWAPMPPLWCWRAGVVVRIAVLPPARYVFLPSRHVFGPGWRTYIVADARVSSVASHMQPYAGPRGGRYQALTMTRGPTAAAARIPAEAMPTQRETQARAMSFRHSGPAPAAGGGPASAAPRPASAPAPARPRAAPARAGRGRGGHR